MPKEKQVASQSSERAHDSGRTSLTFIRLDGKDEVQQVRGVFKMSLHRLGKIKLGDV
jgi:hypothetical protein